ncbi:MAG: prepilin peptidase [Lachnospiraceae bacterium]|nr:prepilin peptidase [Lachnospiraceae bacterium]
MILPLWFKILMGVFLFFLGASVYSFLNVVIFRVPRGEEFVKTRSHCPGCGKLLSPLELIPVVSYVCLGGKCKICGSKIGLRDVSIEVFGGLSAIASFWIAFLNPADSIAEIALGDFYGRFLAGLTVFAFIGALTVITFIQIDMGVVKTGTVVAMTVIVLISLLTLREVDWMDSLIAALVASIALVIIHLIAKNAVPIGLAGMMGVAGIMLGSGKMLFVVLPVSAAVALLQWLFLLIMGKKPLKKHFKLAFALWIGVTAAALAGDYVVKLLGFS